MSVAEVAAVATCPWTPPFRAGARAVTSPVALPTVKADRTDPIAGYFVDASITFPSTPPTSTAGQPEGPARQTVPSGVGSQQNSITPVAGSFQRS